MLKLRNLHIQTMAARRGDGSWTMLPQIQQQPCNIPTQSRAFSTPTMSSFRSIRLTTMKEAQEAAATTRTAMV